MKSTRSPFTMDSVQDTSDSKPQHVPEPIAYPQLLKLVLAAVLLGASIVLVRVAFGPEVTWQHGPAYVMLRICGILITAGIVYCLWLQYCVSGERWILLATVAFTGLIAGQLIYTLSLMTAFDSDSGLRKIGYQWYATWSAAATVVLLFASWNPGVLNRQGRRRNGVRTMLFSLSLVSCAVLLVMNADKLWPRVEHAFPSVPAAILSNVKTWQHYPTLAAAFCLAITLAAGIAFFRRYSREEDAFSSGIMKFLLLTASSQVALLVSSGSFTVLWWVAQALTIAALLVLIMNLGAKFSASFADAHARIEHLEAVHYMSSRLSDTLDLRVVLLALVSDTASMLSARFASVMLSDNEGETLTTTVTHGISEDFLSPSKPQSVRGCGRPDFYSGHTARAFRAKRVCVVDDVYTDVEFVPWRQLAPCDGYSVSVPLMYRDIPLGVMNLFFDKHVPLNDERIRLFETLSSAAAVSIMNAQLYDRVASRDAETNLDASEIPLAS